MTSPTVLLLLVLLGAQLKAPSVVPRERGTVITSTVKGESRWIADWTMDAWTVKGVKAVRFTENGKGHYSPFQQEVRWTLESIWLADGSFFPLQFEKTIRNTQGAIITVEKKTFDPAAGRVKFERRNEKGATETSSFSAAPDVLTVEGIAGILQFFPFAKSGSATTLKAHMLSNEPKLYDVSIEPRGTERVKTLTGNIDCFKIELVPHLGVLNVVRAFYPKTYFWFSVAEPHSWVRFQGLENGPGSPEIIMEAR